jgi:flagellar basal body-associated protein FliL
MYKPSSQDKYESPTSGDIEIVDDSPIGQAKEAAGGVVDVLKKYWILIVIALVVLAVGYVAFDFFVGSIKTTTFRVTDTENRPLAASVKVMDSQGKEIERINSGTSLKLRKGEYSTRVSAAGYKAGQKAFSVVEDGDVTVKLEKNWNLELSAELPDTLVQGEKKTFVVSILNNGSEEVEAGLVFEGTGFSSDKVTFDYQKPVIIAPGTNTDVEVEMQVNSSAKPAGNTGLSGTIRIEGLDNAKAKVTKSFDLLQFNPSSVTINPTKIILTTEEGILKTQPISIGNNNKFALEGIQFKVTVLTKEYTDESTIEKWFQISENNVDVPANDKKTVNLNFTPILGESLIPDSANSEKISAKLEISNTFFKKETNIDVTVNKSKISVVLEGITTQTFTKTGDSYLSKSLTLKIRNSGKLPITGVIVSSTGEEACVTNRGALVENWITFNDFQFESIDATKTQNVIYHIEPKGGNAGEDATCKIKVSFSNPRTGLRESVISDPFLIKLN